MEIFYVVKNIQVILLSPAMCRCDYLRGCFFGMRALYYVFYKGSNENPRSPKNYGDIEMVCTQEILVI